MNKVLEDVLGSISGCEAVSELEGLLPRLAEHAGFLAVTYAEITRLPLGDEQIPYFSSTADPSFVRCYIEQRFAGIDPVLRQAAATTVPFRWTDCPAYQRGLERRKGVKPQVSRLATVAKDFGFDDGYVIPSHAMLGSGMVDSALFSFIGEGPPSGAPERHWLRLIALSYHERMLHLRGAGGTREDGRGRPVLTDRESEVLVWACRGKTSQETADILNISERTVKFHVQQAMSKLGVYNKVHAVALAIRRGLICP